MKMYKFWYFNCYYFYLNSYYFNISLKFTPKGPISNIPALIQIMAWRRPGDKPLSEPMMVRLPTHICVTRPQWVNHCFIHRAWLGHQNLKLCWKFPLFSADWPNFPNPTMHLSLSHHAPFRTEMSAGLFHGTMVWPFHRNRGRQHKQCHCHLAADTVSYLTLAGNWRPSSKLQ